jgi:hypothetical protein
MAAPSLAGLVAFSHLQVRQIRGRQPHSIVRNILYVIDTLLVAWDIAGARQVGVGLGQDDFLAVSCGANNSFGIAFYRPENDGWKGVLAPAGSQSVGTEIWTRLRAE